MKVLADIFHKIVFKALEKIFDPRGHRMAEKIVKIDL